VNQNPKGFAAPAPLRLVAACAPRQAPSDSPQLAQLYRQLSPRLLARVRREVSAPDAVIEDACQVAWARLARCLHEVDHDCLLAWLSTTARREALRALRRIRHECSLEQLLEGDDDGLRLSQRASSLPDRDDVVVDLVAHRERLASVAALPVRQQRVLLLHAAGFDYGEIARRTGDSRRTVERQLLRARRAVRRLAA
jgi:RNA polymerase sigma factor (sigma-70 family)